MDLGATRKGGSGSKEAISEDPMKPEGMRRRGPGAAVSGATRGPGVPSGRRRGRVGRPALPPLWRHRNAPHCRLCSPGP